MPWWAKTGPVRIDYHGNPYGEETSGWPAIQDLRPSEQGLLVRLRYGKHDLRKAYEQNLRNGFSEPRAKALYRRDLKALALRLRAQKAEEAKVNLPALLKAWEDACDLATYIEKAIEALPTTLNALAAKVMVLTAFGMSNRATFDGELASISVLEA